MKSLSKAVRITVVRIVAVIAAVGLAAVAVTGSAAADGGGIHNYTAHFWGTDAQGYTSIDGAVDSAATCGVPPGSVASGQINFVMKGHWPANGPFFMHSVSMTNNTNDYFHLYDIGFLYDNENFHFPHSRLELPAHQTYTFEVNYTGHHPHSTLVFNAMLGDIGRCGSAGNNAWKIVP